MRSRNERNANLAFPYFYVTRDPELLCSPTLCNFTGWFWSSPSLSFISGHPRRSKHRYCTDVHKHRARSYRSYRGFFRSTLTNFKISRVEDARLHRSRECIAIYAYIFIIAFVFRMSAKFLIRSVGASAF